MLHDKHTSLAWRLEPWFLNESKTAIPQRSRAKQPRLHAVPLISYLRLACPHTTHAKAVAPPPSTKLILLQLGMTTTKINTNASVRDRLRHSTSASRSCRHFNQNARCTKKAIV